jgi:hypothetical protein
LTTPEITSFSDLTPDDPKLDGTDGAHPAWWRGHDAGVAAILVKIRKAVIERPDEPVAFASMELNRLVEDLRFRLAFKDGVEGNLWAQTFHSALKGGQSEVNASGIAARAVEAAKRLGYL